MKNKIITSNLMRVMVLFMILIFLFVNSTLVVKASETPIISTPYNGQVLPFHDVILRWGPVDNEAYFLLDVRNITSGDPIYYDQYIAPNSTSFTIPRGLLNPGDNYRWFLRAIKSDGSSANANIQVFRTEFGVGSSDTHFWKTAYADASHIDYFIHAPNSGLDAVFQSAVETWNGISSNVYLHRDYSNTTKELGIYESASTTFPDLLGFSYLGGMSVYNPETADYYQNNTVTYTEICIYHNNIYQNGGGALYTQAVIHETGHALALAHTDGSDALSFSSAPVGNSIMITDTDIPGCNYAVNVPLIMNGPSNMSSTITDVDKAHLKIKWGD